MSVVIVYCSSFFAETLTRSSFRATLFASNCQTEMYIQYVLLAMDYASYRADAYIRIFSKLVQDNGFETAISYTHPEYIILFVGQSVNKGAIRCYKNRNACIVITSEHHPTLSPFDINREIFVDCLAFHWMIRTRLSFCCGFCRVTLIDSDMPCYTCHLQRRELINIRCKGHSLVLYSRNALSCKRDTVLNLDIMGVVIRQLAAITAHHRLHMMKPP